MKEILLTTPTMTGKIYVGTDALAKRLPALTRGQKNFVLTDSNVYALYPHILETYFQNAEVFVLPAGEENKTFQSLYQILSAMAKAKLHRTSRLFALGGGVIGDIGGLASALYMRGISCVRKNGGRFRRREKYRRCIQTTHGSTYRPYVFNHLARTRT